MERQMISCGDSLKGRAEGRFHKRRDVRNKLLYYRVVQSSRNSSSPSQLSIMCSCAQPLCALFVLCAGFRMRERGREGERQDSEHVLFLWHDI